MSKSKPTTSTSPATAADPFQSIDTNELANVAGGAARVTARSSGADAELTAMLTSIGDSIKNLASSQSSGGGGDMMQMMMMMMMMGGGGGSSAAAAPAAAPAPQQPVINISTNARRC
jgi:hypothetical protein